MTTYRTMTNDQLKGAFLQNELARVTGKLSMRDFTTVKASISAEISMRAHAVVVRLANAGKGESVQAVLDVLAARGVAGKVLEELTTTLNETVKAQKEG